MQPSPGQLSGAGRRGAPARPVLAGVAVAISVAVLVVLGGLWLLPPPEHAAVRAQRQAALARAAGSAAEAIGGEIARRFGLLAALAASPALDRPVATLPALDRQARAVAALVGAPIAVADASLARLVDTTQAFGTPLPGLGDAAPALQALETGAAMLAAMPGAGGPVFAGGAQPGAGGPVYAGGAQPAGPSPAEPAEAGEPPHIALAMPVRREGRDGAVIVSRIDAEALGGLLARSAEAEGAAFALLAPPDRLVAATTPPAEAWGELPRRAAAEPGPLRLRDPDGAEIALAAAPLAALPAWRVVAAQRLPAPSGGEAALASILVAAFSTAGLAGMATAGAFGRRARRDVAASLAAAESASLSARAGEAAALHGLAELRRLHDTIPVGLALLDRELRFVSVNAKFASVSGLLAAEHMSRTPGEVLPAGIARPIEEAHGGVLATTRPVIELPITAEAPGAVRNERHFLASCHPAFDNEQRVAGVSVVLQDVTERVRAERTRELLVRELNHRVKNTLATVQSIVAVTLRQAGPFPSRLAADLGARLVALARAHDLLTAHAWETTDLAEVAQAALAPWLHSFPGRIGIDGPTGVLLRPAQAQAVVLALHELATNAVKYGALSSVAGRVALAWRIDPEGSGRRALLRWEESGGPPVAEPPRDRRGFGSRLLERGLAADLGPGAEVRLEFAPGGLRARIAFEGQPTALHAAGEGAPEPEPAAPRLPGA